VENEFINALNEIDGLMVYPCNMCNKICKLKGGLTKHKNSKHVDDVSGSSEGEGNLIYLTLPSNMQHLTVLIYNNI
jgi:hypothetical protein